MPKDPPRPVGVAHLGRPHLPAGKGGKAPNAATLRACCQAHLSDLDAEALVKAEAYLRELVGLARGEGR